MSRTTKRTLRFSLILVTIFLLGAAELAAGESRWYLESKLGQADFDGTFSSTTSQFFDDSHNTVSLEVGYTINPYFSIQVGYHDLGEYDGYGSPCPVDQICPTVGEQPLILCVEGATDPICGDLLVAIPVTADITGLSLTAVPRFPLTEHFSVYGKVGVIDWDADVSENYETFPNHAIGSYSGRDLLTAVGLQYTFPIGIGVLAEYQQLDFDLSSTSVGASYRF